ncbi:MAG TPA: proprotein convertase P-domain-containing protein [Kofleriaceae bacterium]|nr:proprotein convertase P-domain-containing protein [Kofleriaceae bacterium]
MTRYRLLPLFLALPLAACAGGDLGGEPSPFDDDFPLSDGDALFEGAPNSDDLPDENKADAEYPKLHTALLATQSPVKSQGSRGVCSIFSTAALMEHLYLAEGTLSSVDFSEQFLQWSAKFEVNSFPNTSGSNASYNLQAINRFGIVEESVWPYEASEWGSAQDVACDGSDSQPTLCYTNGHPTDDQKNAQRYKLPRGRYLNNRSIKAHITSSGTGVVVGMTFFYQSWNHRRSDLPVNSADWREGIVLYPNAKDKELSLAKRAGHSILIVGWDDDKEVQQRDEAGEGVVDANGDPVMEKGFYIFKNSWGRGSFGVDNPHGDGYGYLSMKYVHEYGSSYVSGLPEVALPVEDCTDEIDNDRNGQTDCDDAACDSDPSCQTDTTAQTFTSSDTPVAIPDNNAVGASSTLTVAASGTIRALSATVDISHTYRGDLKVVLYRGEQSVVLHDRTGGGQDDLQVTVPVTAFDGTDMNGAWKLVVVDSAAQDVGTINGWSIEVHTDAQ